jgi:hypothetical protein
MMDLVDKILPGAADHICMSRAIATVAENENMTLEDVNMLVRDPPTGAQDNEQLNRS